MQTLMIFVDGLGCGVPDPEHNPLVRPAYPVIRALLEKAKPVDACLGVEGLPQSATGQTALLTGLNAPERMGRHIEGFPNAALKDLIRPNNIFSRMRERGYRATFANAYYLKGWDEKVVHRFQSVTTVATLAAFGGVRDAGALAADRAVYQDLTREALRRRGYEGPLISPEDAGRHLLRIAEENDFTLFEYFQTDIAAHRGDADQVESVLTTLNAFLSVAVTFAEATDHCLVLTSDHGNIEDLRIRTHTRNPVPFAVLGAPADLLKSQVKSLTDITPALLTLYPPPENMS